MFHGHEDGKASGLSEATTESVSNIRGWLTQEIVLLGLSSRHRGVALAIIHCIDDDGRLDTSLEEIRDTIQSEISVELADLEIVLRLIQSLDPPGIGARDLLECWLLQLQRLPEESLIVQKAITLIKNYQVDFLKREDIKLKRLLGITDPELLEIKRLIKSLDTKPGRQVSSTTISYIEPDVIVSRSEEDWKVVLNPSVEHKLSISSYYREYIADRRDPKAQTYVKNCLQQANWLIRSLKQRSDTILRVSNAIVQHQTEFLANGPAALKPLKMSEIAQIVDIAESTVSRTVNGKYLRTPHGLFELRSLFPGLLHTNTGGGVSTDAVHALIKKLIANESTESPLSDRKIADRLTAQGIEISRRTITKYRKQMSIGSTSERRDRV